MYICIYTHMYIESWWDRPHRDHSCAPPRSFGPLFRELPPCRVWIVAAFVDPLVRAGLCDICRLLGQFQPRRVASWQRERPL